LALRDRRFRDEHGLFYVEGARFVLAALKARADARALVLAPAMLRHRKLARQVRAPVITLSPSEFRRLGHANEPQGIGLVVRQPWAALDRKPGVWLAFEHVRAPGNLGTCLRTAAAMGARGALFLGEATDPFDPGAVRASMGAIFQQRIVRIGPRHLRAWKRRVNAQVIGTSAHAHLNIDRVRYGGRRPTVIMIGCERGGLSDMQASLCDRTVRIPMTGAVDSLNLASAAAILLYETYRSRACR